MSNDSQTPARATTSMKRAGEIARDWWKHLQGEVEGDGAPRPDRTALAELRRCREPVSAVTVPAFHVLYRRIGKVGEPHGEDTFTDHLAAAAIVLAHVRADRTDKSMARRLGRTNRGTGAESDDETVMSYARFRRLLQIEGPVELMREMRRAVVLLKGDANVADLARSILYWDHPSLGDRIRQRWAFDYFNTEAPGHNPIHPTPDTNQTDQSRDIQS